MTHEPSGDLARSAGDRAGPDIASASRRRVPAGLGAVRRSVQRRPGWWRFVGAVVAGLLIFASFPPRTCWYLAPLGVAVLTLVVRGTGRLRAGFGYGAVAGLAFFVPLLPWTGIYVGPVPWLALSAACAVYVGLFGLLARLVGALPGWPLWVAAVWTLTEWGRSSFPFGGFPWGRLAFGQADGWFLPFASLAGAPGVSFAVALTGTALACVLHGLVVRRAGAGLCGDGSARGNGSPRSNGGLRGERRSRWSRGLRRGGLPVGISAAAIVVATIPGTGVILRTALPAPDDGDRSITVAAIQGSVPRLGLDFNAQRRVVLDNHVRRTEELARSVASGRAARPDVVIWPENSSDIDPLRNADAAEQIGAASAAIGAPILVGAVLANSDGSATNSVIVWNEATGPGERHDKRIIQPFGEYLPMRGLFRHFSQYADRAGYFVPGHGDGVVHARPAGGGPDIGIGVATCWEVAFDRAFETSLDSGAQLLTVPTNNATFGDSEMTYQQLAMSRVRAVEHGRALVVAATSGVSALVTADGTLAQQTPEFVPAALEQTLPLRSATTLATRLGPLPERVVCVLAAVVVGIAAIRRRTSRPRATGDIGDAAGPAGGRGRAPVPTD